MEHISEHMVKPSWKKLTGFVCFLHYIYIPGDQQIHSGEKPKNCDQCDLKCPWKGNLKKHTKVVVSVGGAMIGVGSPGLAGTQLPNCCLHPATCSAINYASHGTRGLVQRAIAKHTNGQSECGMVDTGRVPYWLPSLHSQ